MPGILASPQFPGGNLRRYFFFFLPAFFFILVFSLALDFVAELFFFTGIDTSLTVLLPDKLRNPLNPLAGPLWPRLRFGL